MIVPYGFLTEFTELLLDRYKNRINKDYAFALAEVLLSACCWNIHFVNEFGKGQPNIWIQVILPSGDVKSKPLNEFLRPIMSAVEAKVNEIEGGEFYKQLVISQYTPESIINLMTGEKKRRGAHKDDEEDDIRYIGNIGLIMQDESSMFSRGVQSKDYMSGLLEINSMIYDGKIPERFTNSMGMAKVPYCYKACISATTPVIYGIMSEQDVIQGGWNRYDIITGVPIDIELLKRHNPDTFFKHRTPEQIDDEIDKYATQLLHVTQSKVNMIYLTEEAAAMWCDYEFKQQVEKRQISEKDLRRGYKNRMAEKALKRAVLYAISRHIETIENAKISTILVDEEEMKAAIANQDEYYSHWVKMLSYWKLAPQLGESVLRTDTAKRDRLKAVLHMQEFVSRQRVIEETGWNDGSKHLEETIHSFEEERKVQIISLDNSRELIKKFEQDKKWLDWQKVKIPVRGAVPIFYRWIGTE